MKSHSRARTVKQWKNRLKYRLIEMFPVLTVLVLLAGIALPIKCQLEEDVEDFAEQLHHPDRDFEHVPAPSSKEIITNHIVPDHGEGEDVAGDSHYKDGEHGPEGTGTQRYTEIGGDVVLGEKVLRASESPYSMRTDLEVERRARLIIEAGVTIHFAPMVGITVRGSIVAMVSVDQLSASLFASTLILSLAETLLLERFPGLSYGVEQCLINSTCFVYLSDYGSVVWCFLNRASVINAFPSVYQILETGRTHRAPGGILA
uniref:Uncharacterized protein n=1 Tax=Anopheles culicifacies TaxID=139723 RepID=A0A182M0U9_9DIPT